MENKVLPLVLALVAFMSSSAYAKVVPCAQVYRERDAAIAGGGDCYTSNTFSGINWSSTTTCYDYHAWWSSGIPYTTYVVNSANRCSIDTGTWGRY